jgi:hypothetical protein
MTQPQGMKFNFENMFEGKVLNDKCNLALTKRWKEIPNC